MLPLLWDFISMNQNLLSSQKLAFGKSSGEDRTSRSLHLHLPQGSIIHRFYLKIHSGLLWLTDLLQLVPFSRVFTFPICSQWLCTCCLSLTGPGTTEERQLLDCKQEINNGCFKSIQNSRRRRWRNSATKRFDLACEDQEVGRINAIFLKTSLVCLLT